VPRPRSPPAKCAPLFFSSSSFFDPPTSHRPPSRHSARSPKKKCARASLYRSLSLFVCVSPARACFLLDMPFPIHSIPTLISQPV
jgi:hypothetical protein